MSAKYVIGLDYGTNSVRTLIVNVANGREVATAVWDYEHGEAGVILSRDPNLARQHPADYAKGAEVTIRKALRGGAEERPRLQAGTGDRHRRRHDRQHAAAGRPRRPAARLPEEVRQQPRRHGLAVEGPHRRGRGRGDHRAGGEDPPAVPGQVRRHVQQRMVLQQDPPLPADQPGGLRRRLHLGRMRRLDPRDADRHGGARSS